MMSNIIFIILILAMAVCIARIICNRLEREKDPSNEAEGLSFYDEELIKTDDRDYSRDDLYSYSKEIDNMLVDPSYSWFSANIHHDKYHDEK